MILTCPGPGGKVRQIGSCLMGASQLATFGVRAVWQISSRTVRDSLLASFSYENGHVRNLLRTFGDLNKHRFWKSLVWNLSKGVFADSPSTSKRAPYVRLAH